MFYKAKCPHCGNEINIHDARNTRKCPWCKRVISVKFEKIKGKTRCTVDSVDFSEEQMNNYHKWKEENYGD